jgi:hypothetical protein
VQKRRGGCCGGQLCLQRAVPADSGVMSPAIPTNGRSALRAEVARPSDLKSPTIPT